MLDSLPPELLREVFLHVHSKRHLLALSKVSRKFRSHIFPRLFEVLDIKLNDEGSLWDLDSYPYFAHDKITRVPNVLTAVKALRFCAPFEETDLLKLEHLKRCSHCFTRDLSTSSTDISQSEDDLHILGEDKGTVVRKFEDAKKMEELFDCERGDYGLMKLAIDIVRLLSALPDNQLASFSWEMGTCFPRAILGKEGYLVTHQSCIRKLHIIAAKNCNFGCPPLEGFPNLQHLSWRGCLYVDNCAVLKKFLELNHERLMSLEIDLFDGNLYDDDDFHQLEDLLLPEPKGGYESFWPSLQALSLSAASLNPSGYQLIADQFNIHNVIKLRLWDRLIDGFNLRNVIKLRILGCRFALEFLHYMAQTNVSLRATKVELVLSDSENPHCVDLLAPFDALEDLFLMVQPNDGDEHLSTGVEHSDAHWDRQCYAKRCAHVRSAS